MSRSITVIKDIGRDYRYNSTNVQYLINKLMECGKKSIAAKIVYDAFDIIGDEALSTLEQALSNLSPEAEVRYKKVGGSTCPVPRQPNVRRRQFLAVKWLLEDARSGKGKPMHIKLAEALKGAANNQGKGVDAKNQLQKLADANRAYAGLNW